VLRPVVRYARADDGVAIAYTVLGAGDTTVVVAAPLIGQLEIAWEEPAFEQFMTRLSVGTRLILFDRRGSGLSDRATGHRGVVTPSQLARDVACVLDACAIDRAAVLGVSMGAATALQFAADYPSRIAALITFGARASGLGNPDQPDGMTIDDIDTWIAHAIGVWGTGASVEADGPTMAGNERYRAWAARLERHTASPGGFGETVRAALGADLRPVLGEVRVPHLGATPPQ
jgi:pimeloyl-ACP methyl ester carboxylesterase